MTKLADVLETGQPLPADAPLQPREWDSMVLLSVISLIDETFDVTVPMKELQAVGSVSELLDLIRVSA